MGTRKLIYGCGPWRWICNLFYIPSVSRHPEKFYRSSETRRRNLILNKLLCFCSFLLLQLRFFSAMNAFLIFKCLGFIFFALFLESTRADLDKSFSFPGFAKDSNFSSGTVVYGDAKVVNGGHAVQLTSPESSGAGRVIYRKPIKLVGGNPNTVASFSTCFSFSVSPDNGDGLAFVIVPTRIHAKPNLKTLAVRFRSLSSGKFGDLAEINARIELETHALITTISKASTRNFNLSSSRQFHSWIDYEVGSKRLEVRMADNGAHRPSNPLLSSPVDFFHIFRDEKVFVGLSCSNKNSRQRCLVYSLNFSIHPIPKLVHSQPLNPEDFKFEKKATQVKGRNRFMSVFVALVFGSCGGVLTASMVLYLWAIFGRRRHCGTKVSEEIQPQDTEDEKTRAFDDDDDK